MRFFSIFLFKIASKPLDFANTIHLESQVYGACVPVKKGMLRYLQTTEFIACQVARQNTMAMSSEL